MAKKVPHLSIKGGRFYFRMRTPLPLVPFLGAEVSKALGDVTKAQAEVMARELAGEHAAHRRVLARPPPTTWRPSSDPLRVNSWHAIKASASMACDRTLATGGARRSLTSIPSS